MARACHKSFTVLDVRVVREDDVKYSTVIVLQSLFVSPAGGSTEGEARLSSASACLAPMAMSEVVYRGEVLQTEVEKGKDAFNLRHFLSVCPENQSVMELRD